MESDDPSAGVPVPADTSTSSGRVPPADRLHDFLHQCLDATLTVTATDDAADGFQISGANAPALQLIGLSAEDFIGQPIDSVLPPGTSSHLMRRLRIARSAGRAERFESELWNGDEVRTIRWQVVPLREELLLQAYDVTESHRAQSELRDSQEYLTSVIANAPIIIYELDRDGVFKLSAGRSLTQIGLAPGQAVGGSIFDFFEADSPEVAAFQQALDGETVSTTTQLGEGFFESRYTPRYDDKGAIVGVLGVSYDVTERRQAEERLQRAQRMEAVGQLTGGIAHDFNNLLAVILGNLDLLSQQPLTEQAEALIDQAVTASQRGADLIKRLLAFSRRQLLEPRATDVNALVEGMLQLLARAIPENIEIVFEPARPLWPTHVDPGQLEAALLNLCVNARDAMPSGGGLRITTRNLTVDDQEAAALVVLPGDYVETCVTDTGPGIESEYLRRIFEPFFTTKEPGKGSGLGLSMVYGFVSQSNGAVEVHSDVGQGTCMRLLLPRATAEELPVLQDRDASDAPALGNGELILVVEDDAAVRHFVCQALQALNYRVLQAEDSRGALELLDRHDDVALLLSDVVLPGGTNGIETYQQASRSRPDLRAVFTTGYLGSAAEVDPQTIASLDLIGKPYRVADLASRVRQALDR